MSGSVKSNPGGRFGAVVDSVVDKTYSSKRRRLVPINHCYTQMGSNTGRLPAPNCNVFDFWIPTLYRSPGADLVGGATVAMLCAGHRRLRGGVEDDSRTSQCGRDGGRRR